jgi:hypothetical protein
VAAKPINTRLSQHYDIKAADYILMQSKTLPDLALNQIPSDSRFDMLA